MARLVADLPKLKAAVDLADPPTVRAPGRGLPEPGAGRRSSWSPTAPGRPSRGSGRRRSAGARRRPAGDARPSPAGRPRRSGPSAGGLLRGGDGAHLHRPAEPGDPGHAQRRLRASTTRWPRASRALTESEIAFALDGRVQAATLPAARLPRAWQSCWTAGTVAAAPGRRRVRGPRAALASLARPRAAPAGGRADGADPALAHEAAELPAPAAHGAWPAPRWWPWPLATLLSYAVARTVTRPLARHHRHHARDGGHRRPHAQDAACPRRAWDDEDARLLASSFNDHDRRASRASSARRPQRERLSALGRLSTVIAHEVRNPLMIIKAAIRTLRQDGPGEAERREALARHRRRGRAPQPPGGRRARLRAARPVRLRHRGRQRRLPRPRPPRHGRARVRGGPPELDPGAAPVVTDGERLRTALVNVLTNARDALDGAEAGTAARPTAARPAAGHAARGRDRVVITVQDRGRRASPRGPARGLRALLHHQARRHRPRPGHRARTSWRPWAGTIAIAAGPARAPTCASSCRTRPPRRQPARPGEGARHDPPRLHPPRRRRGEDPAAPWPAPCERRGPRGGGHHAARARPGACSRAHLRPAGGGQPACRS